MAVVTETTWLSTIWQSRWKQCMAVPEWCATGSVTQWAWSLLVRHFFWGYTKVYPQTNPALIGSGLIWFELSTWARQDKLRLNDKVIAVTVLLKHLPGFASISDRPGPSFSKGGRRAPLDISQYPAGKWVIQWIVIYPRLLPSSLSTTGARWFNYLNVLIRH